MQLTIPSNVFKAVNPSADQGRYHDHFINIDRESVEEIQRYIEAADALGERKFARALNRIIDGRKGDVDAPVPSFEAFQAAVLDYLRTDNPEGQIYVRHRDGTLYPELVTDIHYTPEDRNGRPPKVTILTAYIGVNSDAYGDRRSLEEQRGSHIFYPGDVARRRPSATLQAQGIFRATSSLASDHATSVARFDSALAPLFGKTLITTGSALTHGGRNREHEAGAWAGRKVIHDVANDEHPRRDAAVDSILSDDDDGQLQVPFHPVLRVFDLKTHEFYWMHGDQLQPHEYDKSLANKLILPDSHRDLLNILTTDLQAFVGDVIEGKSAGNVILCKGVPGVGKTLTAEVYAELTEKPLYAVHAGNLGTSASAIESELRTVFGRTQRWDCVLLLDEADVFVTRRGDNIEQNAIVAEFLRSMEYFTGLMFMTTNRPDSIDDAILSRCAAVIGYQPPNQTDAARIWRVMAANFAATDRLPEHLIQQLVVAFDGITARDVKMLLRLALRVSLAHKEPLTLDLFRRCAMFRALPESVTFDHGVKA